jgi:hypothetical protein
MAQAVCRRPVTAEDRFRFRVTPCDTRGTQSGTGTGFSPSSSVFSEFFSFLLSISFDCGSPCLYITWGMNGRPVGGRSSETSSDPINMNNKNPVIAKDYFIEVLFLLPVVIYMHF